MKHRRLIWILSFILSVVLESCDRKSHNYNGVLNHYESDPMKYRAALFLINNIKYHYGTKYKYVRDDGKDFSNYIATYPGNLTASQVLDSLGVQMTTEDIPDSSVVDENYLIASIDAAFESYNAPFSHKLPHYSFDIFLNYVLPYRVGYEECNDWKLYSRQRYLTYLSTFNVEQMSVKRLYQVINLEQTGTSNYALQRLPHISRPALNQTIDQIHQVRVPFDCEDYAIRSLYILRSLGIPSAYEKIPLWGKFNYGHAQESILFENGKFYPVLFNDTVPFKYQIAKMYRRTFQQQGNPFKEIKRNGEDILDIPGYFNYSDYIDITGERTEVSDIYLNNIPGVNHKVLYLCVYNGGEWKPVEWGKINKHSKSLLFPNMGRKILYHLAAFERGKVKLMNSPFTLDTSGVVHKLQKDFKSDLMPSMVIANYDRNSAIEPNQNYELDYWDNESHKWAILFKKTAVSSELSFSNVPKNRLYKIEPVDGKSNEAVRPFTFNDKQIWW